MLDPRNGADVAGAGLGLFLAVLILGAVMVLVTTVLTRPFWLALISAGLMIGGIVVRLYYSKSTT